MGNFNRALAAYPNNDITLNTYAKALQRQAFRKHGRDQERFLAMAISKYTDAQNHHALLTLGKRLFTLVREVVTTESSLHSYFHLIYWCYNSCTTITNGLAEAFYHWGVALCEHFRMTQDFELYREAGEKFRLAIEHGATVVSSKIRERVLELAPATLATIVQLSQGGQELSCIATSKCDTISEEALVDIGVMCGNQIELLELVNVDSLTDETMFSVVQHCHNLRTVILRGCRRLSSDAVVAIATECRSLHILDLSKCGNIGDTGIVALSKYCSELRECILSECDLLTDDAIVQLAHGCPRLELLELRYCHQLTDRSIIAVAEQCHGLRSLDMHSLANVTDASVSRVAVCAGERLESLILSHCVLISSVSLLAIAQYCHRLRKLGLTDCRKVSNEALEQVARSCPNIKTLLLGGCSHVQNKTISQFAKMCASLQSVDLSSCSCVGNDALVTIGRHSPDLSDISFEGSATLVGEEIEDETIYALCRPGLTSLRINRCRRVTDRAISHVAKHCRQLQSLSLSNTALVTDQSLSDLGRQCRELVHLELSHCDKISRKGILRIAENCDLQTAVLRNCRLMNNDCIRGLVECCPLDLLKLDLSGCTSITNDALIHVARRCLFLRSLTLKDIQHISDAGVMHLTRCTKLTELNLSACHKVTDSSLALVAQACTCIKRLDVGLCENVTGDSVSLFARSSLRRLNVEYNRITDAAVCNIARSAQYLRHLNLSWCSDITDASLVALANGVNSLQRIDLSRCFQITDYAIQAIATRFPSLTMLSLNRCANITDRGLEPLADNCPQLQELDLSGPGITDVGLINVVSRCTGIEVLFLKGCTGITQHSITAIANHLPRLSSLAIGGKRCTEALGDEAISELVTHNPMLTSLDIAHCLRVTDFGVAKIAYHCHAIRELNIASCPITGEAILRLAGASIALESLNVSGCESITVPSLVQLVRNCRFLTLIALAQCNQLPRTISSILNEINPLLEIRGR